MAGRGRVKLTMPPLGRIDPEAALSAERQVYALLRKAIMAGLFKPGDGLSERSLAERFDVSPSPVRGALKRLEADGVLEGRRKSAYFLHTLTRSQYLEIMEMRLLIEKRAVAAAARKATAKDVARLKAIHVRHGASAKEGEDIAINHAFHFEIYKIGNPQILLELVENLWLRVGPLIRLYMAGYEIEEILKNHARMIDALRRRNPRDAERALESDLRHAMDATAPFLTVS